MLGPSLTVTTTRTHSKLEYGEASGAPTGSYHKGRVWKTWDGDFVRWGYGGDAVAESPVLMDIVERQALRALPRSDR